MWGETVLFLTGSGSGRGRCNVAVGLGKAVLLPRILFRFWDTVCFGAFSGRHRHVAGNVRNVPSAWFWIRASIQRHDFLTEP